jgi:transposase InsO family protein
MPLSLRIQFLLFSLAGLITQDQLDVIGYQRAEIRVLREQLGKRRLVFTDAQRRLLARLGKVVGRKGLREHGCLVTPDTIMRWYRELIARKYDSSEARRGKGKPGRPRIREVVAKLIVRIALENTSYGYTRIRDTLFLLKHDVCRSTVARVLDAHGILPAPERDRKTSWKEFFSVQGSALAAADFFTVEVLTLFGFVRYHVFFVMEIATRRVEIAGIVADPTSNWLLQIVRNLTDCTSGFLLGKRHLILDRDPLYTKAVRRLLEESGVGVVRLPRKSPNLNAHAERFVLSIKSEALNRIMILGEDHLRLVVSEYTAHYHTERPHQGLGGALIEPDARAVPPIGEIACRQRLGGLLRYYYRKAA